LQHYREQVFQKLFAKPLIDEPTQIQSLSIFKNADAVYNVRVDKTAYSHSCFHSPIEQQKRRLGHEKESDILQDQSDLSLK
jgi:hypothetical protein